MTRRLLCFVAIFGAGAGLAVACAFPDVTYEPPSVEKESPQKSPHDAGTSCECEDDSQGKPKPETGPEAGPLPRVDPETCKDRLPCDCDDDGFAALDCPKDPSTINGSKGPLKPGDCDDLDPRRFPGQTFRSDTVDNGFDGDWDCNGVVETTLSMIVCGGTGATGCTGGVGVPIVDGGPTAVPCGQSVIVCACQPDIDAQAPCRGMPTGAPKTQTCK